MIQLQLQKVALIAKEQRVIDTQVAMFLSYTSVFNSVLHMTLCEALSPHLSVLKVDYSVDCYTDTHRRFQIGAAVLTSFLILVRGVVDCCLMCVYMPAIDRSLE